LRGSTTLVLVVYNQLDLTRACLESVAPTTAPFDLCVIDNGSTDGTEEFFRHLPYRYSLSYQRNHENVGLIRGLNQGLRLARGEFLCFLHNDTVMLEREWLARLRASIEGEPGVGLAGLYGAQRLRRDGRYVGRTIIHCLEGSGNLRGPSAEVAAVDGVCLLLRRAIFDSVGGLDEAYGFFHGYDRDLSFAIREAGLRCVVVNAPFIHRGGGTRTAASSACSVSADLAARRTALARFARKWKHRLPCDVRPPYERVRQWFAARLARR
jgi:GT2 family glycosyltransferase